MTPTYFHAAIARPGVDSELGTRGRGSDKTDSCAGGSSRRLPLLTSKFKLQMAIAHFMGADPGALPLARAPVLVFKADLQPQPEAVPSDSGLTSDSESGCHSQAQRRGPRLLLTTCRPQA